MTEKMFESANEGNGSCHSCALTCGGLSVLFRGLPFVLGTHKFTEVCCPGSVIQWKLNQERHHYGNKSWYFHFCVHSLQAHQHFFLYMHRYSDWLNSWSSGLCSVGRAHVSWGREVPGSGLVRSAKRVPLCNSCNICQMQPPSRYALKLKVTSVSHISLNKNVCAWTKVNAKKNPQKSWHST